jgi:hypothetical protein
MKFFDEPRRDRNVRIKGKDGNHFFPQPASPEDGLPYNLPDLGLTREEIVAYIKKVRERQ